MSSLYIHVPFCEKKCAYCSFVVTIGQENNMSIYIDSVLKEAQAYQGQKIKTMYLGGGTPSMLGTKLLIKLREGLEKIFELKASGEITIEMNPEDVNEDKMRALKACGFNRISLGVQTFNDDYLRYLGRNHDSASALEAFKVIERSGIKNVSCDLMFGFEGQSLKECEEDLKRMVGLRPQHISLYGLSVEPNSKFFSQGRIMSNHQQKEMYELIMAHLKDNGYAQYEISNFADEGFQSLHNKNYWMGGNYIGLGIGAHSHCDGRRWWNITNLYEYLTNIKEGRSPQAGKELLSQDERAKERFLFGLRMNDGVEAEYKNIFDEERNHKLEVYIREGLLELDGPKVKATDKGRLVLDGLCAQLI